MFINYVIVLVKIIDLQYEVSIFFRYDAIILLENFQSLLKDNRMYYFLTFYDFVIV